jgi:hypothetical protein
MKKNLLTTFYFYLFIGWGAISFAQQNKIDSLLTLLKTDKADTNKLIHLYKLSDESEIIGNYDDGINPNNSLRINLLDTNQ